VSCLAGCQSHGKDGFTSCTQQGGGKVYPRVVTVYRDYVPSVGYKVCNKLSGKCLDAGTSRTAGTQIAQRTFDGSAGQVFNVIKVSADVYKIVNATSGLALDGSGNLNNDQWAGSARLLQNVYTGTITQKWRIQSLGGSDPGLKQMVPGNFSNWSMTVPNGGDGVGVTTGSWLSNDYQKWTVSPL